MPALSPAVGHFPGRVEEAGPQYVLVHDHLLQSGSTVPMAARASAQNTPKRSQIMPARSPRRRDVEGRITGRGGVAGDAQAGCAAVFVHPWMRRTSSALRSSIGMARPFGQASRWLSGRGDRTARRGRGRPIVRGCPPCWLSPLAAAVGAGDDQIDPAFASSQAGGVVGDDGVRHAGPASSQAVRGPDCVGGFQRHKRTINPCRVGGVDGASAVP